VVFNRILDGKTNLASDQLEAKSTASPTRPVTHYLSQKLVKKQEKQAIFSQRPSFSGQEKAWSKDIFGKAL